jgi:dihydroorotase
MIHHLTAGPAKILGLPYGTLSVNAMADICIFDPTASWQLDSSTIRSNGHNTPFMGWEMKGRVTHTLLAGKLVYTVD